MRDGKIEKCGIKKRSQRTEKYFKAKVKDPSSYKIHNFHPSTDGLSRDIRPERQDCFLGAPVQESNGRQPRQKGCYYLSDHYDNGERIDTNEPCLNCTCLNSMLMCYLRICPFVKPVGEECIIEREEGDCCPKIWCPEVIKDKENTPKSSEKRKQQQPGCYLEDQYYPDGAMLPHDPKRPCEVCYCIRNSTACVMQECELKVDGCSPIYKEGQCCPCRYNCTYEEATPTPPGVTLMELADPPCIGPVRSYVLAKYPSSGVVRKLGEKVPAQVSSSSSDHGSKLREGCTLPDGSFVEDGEAVNSTNPCEHCYCMRNEVVCAIQECQAPGSNCRPVSPKPDQCCPDRYECLVNTISPNSFEKPISLQFSTVFTTSFGTTTTSLDLVTLKGKITDGSKVKGAPKKEVVDEIPSPVYIPPQQTKSTESSDEDFSTVPSISQKSSTLSESHIQEGVTLISTLIDSSSLVPSTESVAEVEENVKSITVTSAESLFSDKFTAKTSEKILTEDVETTISSLSDEKSSELTSTYYETSRTRSPTDQSQQTTIQAEAINSEEHYKKVTVHEEKRKPTEKKPTTIQDEIISTIEYSQKSTSQEYTSSTEYSHESTTHGDIKSSTEYSQESTTHGDIKSSTEYSQESTTHGDIKSSIEYSSPTTIQAETSSPTELSQQTTGQTDISHSTGISQETTSETQPPRKSYGVKGSSFSHKSSSTHTPSAAPGNAEVSTESYSSEKTSSSSEYDTSHSSANTTQTLKKKADSVKESTFSPPNIIRVKGRRPSTPSEEPEKVSSTQPTTASQEYSFKEGESDDNKIKQPTGVKSSQKKGHIKGKRPQIKEKPLLPVGVIPGEKKQSASTTAFPSVKGRPSVMSIPGEGSCHIGKVSYKHGQDVPSSDVCKMSCQCSRGKIYCVEVVCEILQHENYGECQLVRNQSQCCPHYECGTSITKPAEYLDITEFTSVDGVFVSSTTVQRTGTYTTESSSVFPISSTESTVVKDHVFKTDATTEPSYSTFTKETSSSSSSSTTAPFSTSSTEISHISNEVEVSTIVDYTDFSAHENVSIHEEGFPTEESHPQEDIETTSVPTKLFSVAETSEEAATASVNYDSTVKEIKYTTQETSTAEKEFAEFTSGEASTESPVTENSDAVSSTVEETDSVASKYPSTVLDSTSTVEETPKTTFEDLTVEKIEGILTTAKSSSFPSITSEEQTETPEVGIHTDTDQKSSTLSEVTSTSEVITERYSHSDSVGVTEDIHHSETVVETSTHSSVISTKISFEPEVTDKFDTIAIEKDVGTTFEYETSSDKEETSFETSIKPLEASESSEDSEKLTSPKTIIISAHEESSVTPSPEEANYEAESIFQTDPSLQEKFTFRSTTQTGHPSTQTPFVDSSSTEKPQPTVVDLSSTEKHQPSIVETVVSEDDNTELSSTTVVVPSSDSQSPEYIPKTVITSTVPTDGLDDVSGTTVSKVGTEESHLAETTTIVSKVDSTVLSESDLPSDLHTQHSSTGNDIAELQTTSPHPLQTKAQQDGISTDSVNTSTRSDIVHSIDASTSDAAHSTTLKEHDITDSTERTAVQSHTVKSTDIQESTETPTSTQKDIDEQEEPKIASGISEEHEVTFTTKKEQEEEKTTFHVFKDTTTDSNDITTRFSEHSQGTSTITPIKDDFSAVSSASTTAEKGLSFDIIDVDSSDDSVKFTETILAAVSSTEGTETSSKRETDAESDISHENELTTPSSKPEGSSIDFSIGTLVFEETTSKQETGAETDKSDEAVSTSLSPKVAESSSTFEDSFHFEETTATQKVDIVSDINQQEQFTSPSSESGYSIELQTESSFHDGTEAPKPIEETDVSPITLVSENGKTTSKSEESSEETLKKGFSGVSLDSETTDGEINESAFSTVHTEEIRSSSVSGISSTQTPHELDYDTKSITPVSVSVSEQDSTVSEENFTSVGGTSTTDEEKLLPSEEVLNPTYEVADNEISNDFVTEFPNSDDGKFENEGIFSKKKPGIDSDEEAIKSEKHTTESYAEVIKPEQHTTESNTDAIEPEKHTTESHAESIKPEKHITESHIEDIEPEQHTTESHIEAIEPEQHTTESHAESIKPEQHTTKSHIEVIEPEQHTTESHAESIKPEQLTTQSHFEVSTSESETFKPHEETMKTKEVVTHIPESTVEEKVAFAVETSSEKEIPISHEYQEADSQFPGLQETSTDQSEDKVYITESEDYEGRKVYTEASDSYGDITSQGLTDESEKSTVDLIKPHKTQDHAEKSETITSTSSTTSSTDHETSRAELTYFPSSTERSTFTSDSVTTVESVKSTPLELSHSSDSLVIETSDVSITEHDSSPTVKPETVESIATHKDGEFKPFSVESTSLPIMIIDGASTHDEKTIQAESSSPSTILSHEDIETTQEPHHSTSTSADQPKVDETILDEDKTSGVYEEATKDANNGLPVSESTEYHSEKNDKTIISSTDSHHETSPVPKESANAITDAAEVPSSVDISTSEPENLILKDVTGSTAQDETEASSSTVKDITSKEPATEYSESSVSPTQLSTIPDEIEDSERTETRFSVTGAILQNHPTEDASLVQDIDSRHTSPENVEDVIYTRVFTTYEPTQDENKTPTIIFETTEKPTTLQKASTTVSESTTTVQPHVAKNFASTSVAGDLTSTKIPEHSTHTIAEFDHDSSVVDHSEDEETIETFTDPPKQPEKPESHIKLSHTQRPLVSVEDVTTTVVPQTPAVTEKQTEEKVESSIATTEAASEDSDGSFNTSKASELTSKPETPDIHTVFSSDSIVAPTVVHSGTSTFLQKSEVITQTVQTPVLLETTQFTSKEDSPTEHEATEETKDEDAEPMTHATEKDDFTVPRTTTSSDIHINDVSESSELSTSKPLEVENNLIEDSGKFTDHEEAHTEATTVSKFSETTTTKEEQSIVFANTPESVSPEESYDHSVLQNATEMISTEIDTKFQEHEKTTVTISAQAGEISTSTSSEESNDVPELTGIEIKSKTTLTSEISASTDSSTKAETSSIRVEEGLISTEYSELQKHATTAPEISELDDSKPTEIASQTSDSYFSTEDSSLIPKIKVTSEEAITHSETFDHSSTVQGAETTKTELTTKEYSEHVTSSSFIHQAGDETTYDSANEQSELDLETEFQTSAKPVDDENTSAESGLKHSTSFVEQSEETDESFGEHTEYTSTSKVVSENELKDPSVSIPSTTISVRDGLIHSTFTTVYDLISTPKPLKLDVVTESQHSTDEYLPSDTETAEKLHETDKYLDVSTTKEEKPSTIPISQSEDEAVKDSVIKQVTEKHEDSESTYYEGLEAGSTTYAAKEFTATTSGDVVVKATTSKELSSDILPKDSITDHGKMPSSSTFSPEATSDIQQDTEAGLTDSDTKADAEHSATTKYPQETEDIRLITEEAQEIFGSTKTHLVNDTKGVSLPESLLTDSDIINEFTSPSDSKHSSQNVPDLTPTSLTHTTDQISTQDHGFHKQTYAPEILDEGLEENIKEFFSITSTVKSNATTSPGHFTKKSAVNLSSLPEISSDITETSLDNHKTVAESLSVTKESPKGSDSSILTTFPSFIPENLIDSSVIPSEQGNLPTADADTTYVNQDIAEKKPFASSSTAVTEVNKSDESHFILTQTVNESETELVNQTLQVADQKETSPTLGDKETVTSDSKVTTISDKSGFETSSSSSVSPTQDYGFHKEVYYPPKHEESTQFVQHYDTTKLPTSFSTYSDESITQKSEIPESSAHSDSTFESILDTQTDQSVTVGKKSTTDFAVTSIRESTDAHTDVPTEEMTDKVTETSSDDTEIHVTDSDHASSVFSTSDVTSTFHTGSVSGSHSSDEDEMKQKSSLHTQTTISSSGVFTTEYAKTSVENQKVTYQTQEDKLTEEPHFDMSSASSLQTISNEETKKKDESETVTATELSSTSRKPTDYDYLYTTYISHISSSDGFSKDADSFPAVKLETTGTTKEDTNVEEQHSTLHSEGSDILTTASDNVASANISEDTIIQTKLTTGYEPIHLINDTTTDRVSDLDTSELLRKTTVQDFEVSSITDNSTTDSFDAEVHSTKYEISSKTVTFLPEQTDIVSTNITEIFKDSTSTPQDHIKAVGVTSTQDNSDLHTEFSFNDGISEHHNIDKIDGSDNIISTKSPSTSNVDQFSTLSGHQNESFTETVHETTKSYGIKNEEGKFANISGAHTSSSTSVAIETLGVSGHYTSSTHIPTSSSFETSSYVFESSPGQEIHPEGVEKVYDIESFTIKESVSNETSTKIETDSTFIASDSWNLSGDQDNIVTINPSVSDDKSVATEAHSTFSSRFASTSTEHAVGSTTTHPQTSTSWDVDTGETSSTAGTSKSQEGVTSSVHYASSSTPHGEILETISSFFPHSSPPSILFESHKSSSLSSSSTTTSSTSHKHTTAKPTDDTTHHFPEDGYCLYENEVYNSAEQIPRKDPCEFCFCFRGDIICLQQSCPPPIRGCYATPINGFCCPRFHCPVQEMHFNLSTTTTTTPDPRIGKYLPPADQSTGCEIEGNVYRVHQVVRPSSGPCMLCRCEMGGIMKCDPRDCQPQAPLLLRLNREFFKKR
ncbi:hypothetical protein AVEN_143910-1 [Araneus ventricosus]|uniref:VWFC domain-containing protein n=1 Tax=Araneus ventricosus TaxID=182803 RepID=A0A4Y2EMP5_ARAVE|nr:hypothetical protein AVEN_143910-1 [Araneus ventricosus]